MTNRALLPAMKYISNVVVSNEVSYLGAVATNEISYRVLISSMKHYFRCWCQPIRYYNTQPPHTKNHVNKYYFLVQFGPRVGVDLLMFLKYGFKIWFFREVH